jgi:hypothetical protein
VPDSLARGSFDPPFERYRWTVATEPVLGEEGLTEVTVGIEWKTGSFPLRTLLFRRPSLASLDESGGARR